MADLFGELRSLLEATRLLSGSLVHLVAGAARGPVARARRPGGLPSILLHLLLLKRYPNKN